MDKRIRDVAAEAFGSFDLAKVRLQAYENRAAYFDAECTRIINELIGKDKTRSGQCTIPMKIPFDEEFDHCLMAQLVSRGFKAQMVDDLDDSTYGGIIVTW